MSAMPGRERAAALEVLGLPSGATPEQITRAYRHLARVTHPDVTGATDPAAGDRFAAISDAYQRLVAAPSPPAVGVHTRVQRPATARPGWPVGWARPLIVAGPVVMTPLPSQHTSEGRR
jgi:hypothetical protein